MKTPHILLTTISIAALAAMYGCNDSSSDAETVPCNGECEKYQTCIEETNTCEDNLAGSACTEDSECSGDLVCEEQRCVATCTDSDDCEGDLVCRSGKCVPECEDNDDCEGNWICQEAKCKPECIKDADCNGFLVCKDNQCKPQCEETSDCDEARGEICHAGQCRMGCVEDADCPSNHCIDEACVDCEYDDHCAQNETKTLCVENNCVECDRDDDCAGNWICVGHACEPICRDNDSCVEKDSSLPYCLDDSDNDYANAKCVECTADAQCEGNRLCKDNSCKFECEVDLDCNGDQKCNLTDNHCYDCITNADCGSNQFCDNHVCDACEAGDFDCDGLPDEEDACPYNPNVKVSVSENPDVDCNYVTDADGTRVFEIWHASDFERLKQEINELHRPILPEECKPVTDPDHPAIGECCMYTSFEPSCEDGIKRSCSASGVVEKLCEYGCDGIECAKCLEHEDGEEYVAGNCCSDDFEVSCNNNKTLKCEDGIVVEESCTYGCGDNECALCLAHTEGADYVAGNCCSDGFEASCNSNKAQKCENGLVVEETCAYGCDDTVCSHCNTPEEGADPAVGDCCDAMVFKPFCRADGQSALECVNGVVIQNPCTDCLAFGENEIVCKPEPKTSLKARLMVDLNLADMVNEGELVDKPFDPLTVPWRTLEASEDGELVETVHNPGESGYTAFTIPEPTCVMRWNPISLQDVQLDGQNHRIFVKNTDGQNCSLVDPFFDRVWDSNVSALSFNYNMRGTATAVFAREIKNSVLENVHFAGNINLENKPVLNEVDEAAYISNNTIISNNYYGFGIVCSPYSESTSNYYKDIRFKGNVTQNSTMPIRIPSNTGNKSPAGFYGLFGILYNSFVVDSSVSIPDYILSNERSLMGWAMNIQNSRIISPSVEMSWIGTNNQNDTAIHTQLLVNIIKNSQIVGDISLKAQNMLLKGGLYSDIASEIDKLNTNGNIIVETGNIYEVNNDYGLTRYWDNSNHLGDISAKRGSISAVGNVYSFTDYFRTTTINGNVSINVNGDINGNSYFGIAYNPTNSSILGNLTVRLQNIRLKEDYVNAGWTSENVKLNNIDIITGDLWYRNYFGLYYIPKRSSVSGTTSITTGNHTSTDTYVGLSYDTSPLTVGDVSIKTGDITAPVYYYGLGKQLGNNAITLNGKTRIEVGNLTNLGPYYGLAINIDNTCKDVVIKTKDISQSTKKKTTYTTDWWGLSNVLGGSARVSNITIDIGNISTSLYVSGLFETCDSGATTDNIKIKTGDITIVNPNDYKGDFDGICRNVNTTLSNIDAKFGNVFISGGYRGWALGTYLNANGKLERVKVDMDALISEDGRVGAVDEISGSIDGVGVIIRHLQTNAAEASGIVKTNANASIKNMSYYADVYAKSNISSGFVNNITDASLTLENIFSSTRINNYSTIDNTTHKASNASVIHTIPMLFNALPNGSTTVEDTTNPTYGTTYKLTLAKTQNVYWLMRDPTDKASEKPFVSLDGDIQFPGYSTDATEFALQSGSTDLDPKQTLSGCPNAASCSTVWDSLANMKVIKEPRGDTIYIPWIK